MFVSVVSLLHRNREFRCFDWTETNRRPTNQFKRENVLYKGYVQLSHLIPVTTRILREHILISFTEKLGFFRFFSFFFLVYSVFSLLYRNREFRCFDWTETSRRPTQFKREYVLYKRYVQLSHLIPVNTHILNVVYTCVSVHKILHNVHIMSQSM